MGTSQSKKQNRLVALEVANRRRRELEHLQEAVLASGSSFRSSGQTNIDIEPSYKSAPGYYAGSASQISLRNAAWQQPAPPDKQVLAPAYDGSPRTKKASRRRASQQQQLHHGAGLPTARQQAQAQRHPQQTLPQNRQASSRLQAKARRQRNLKQQQQQQQLPMGTAAHYYATSCQNLDVSPHTAPLAARQSYDGVLFEADDQREAAANDMQAAYALNYDDYYLGDAAGAGYGYAAAADGGYDFDHDGQENLWPPTSGSYEATRGPRYKLSKRGLAPPGPLASYEQQQQARYNNNHNIVAGSYRAPVGPQDAHLYPARPATASGVVMHRDHPIYLPFTSAGVGQLQLADGSSSSTGATTTNASAASTARAAADGPQGQQRLRQAARSELGGASSASSRSSVSFIQQQQQQPPPPPTTTSAARSLDPHRTQYSVLDCAVLPNKNTNPTLVSGNASYCPFSQTIQFQSQQTQLLRHNNSTFQNNNNDSNLHKNRRQQQQQQQQQQQRQRSSSSSGIAESPELPTRQANSSNLIANSMDQQQHPGRGLALARVEREKIGLLGHLPAVQQNLDSQINWVLNYLDNVCQPGDELAKYIFLRNLKDFDEKLFYATLMRNVEKLMPIVYTPTVGLGCQKFSDIYMRPRGLFITPLDLGRIHDLLANWPQKEVRVIVVTDGERILGLGDLGANGMGISIGKLSLYTALAGLAPKNVLPVTLDVGTDNQKLLDNPFYIGLRQKRIRGQQYDLLVNEFMQAVVSRWGHSCLIQFEDFGNHNAFRLLQTYRKLYCTFNDDIQGTASVCLSGLLSASRLIGRRLSDCSFLFYGAGEANLGTAELLELAMVEEGLNPAEAREHIWLVDSKGLVVASRENLTDEKRRYARQDAPASLTNLLDIVEHSQATAIIGASAQANSFNEAICKKMAELNERPIIFALSNPTSKAECTAEQAYKWTGGRCVFASGSPFEPFTYDGRKVATGQGNNAYIFPAVGLAAIAAHLNTIPTETFLVAARALSDQLINQDTSLGLIYPNLARIRQVTLEISARVLEYFFSERLATYRPEPSDKRSYLKSIQYDPTR